MKNNFAVLGQLVSRELKIFLKDKASVFFSLLAPLIILALYIFFLGDLQLDAVKSSLNGTAVSEKAMKSFIDGWMLAGVVSVACITVSFSAYNIVISDNETGALMDIMASPVRRWIIAASYYIYNFLVTVFICSILLVIVFIYLAIAGWYLTAAEVFAIIGLTVLSIVSSTLVTTVICSFLKTTNSHSAFVGILSAIIGFLIGAYMPLDMYPKAVQYIVLFVPGTYSAGIFRQLFMNGALNEIAKNAPTQAVEALKNGYSMELDFFGKKIESDKMAIAFFVSIVIFVLLNVFIKLMLPKILKVLQIKKQKHYLAELAQKEIEKNNK